jgi:hypothetical protein
MNAGLVAKGLLAGAVNGALIGLAVVGGATAVKHPMQRARALRVTAAGALVGGLIGAYLTSSTNSGVDANAISTDGTDSSGGTTFTVSQPKPLGSV